MVQARQHVVPQSKQPNSWSSPGTSCPQPHRPSIVASVGVREPQREVLALTVPGPARSGKLIVFIGPIKFLDRKDLSQVGIIGPYRGRWRHKRGEWMEIGQVEAFLAVGTFGGFRRAADALRVSQPAVSARIRTLEDSLGVSLFERGRGGLALSPAGRAARPGRPGEILPGGRPPRAPGGSGGPAAGLLRSRIERLDAEPRPLPDRGARTERRARGRDDRDRQAHGRARDWARVPAPP